MAETYKPGDTVPKTGKVECTQSGIKDNVGAGDRRHAAAAQLHR